MTLDIYLKSVKEGDKIFEALTFRSLKMGMCSPVLAHKLHGAISRSASEHNSLGETFSCIRDHLLF